MSKNLAFLGLGVMGSPMTCNLLRQGYAVKAWNRTGDRPGVQLVRETGGTITPSIAVVVQEADYIFTCVADVPDVQEILLGASGVIHFAKPDAIIVDFSTIGPTAAQEIAAVLAEKNLHFLDAPVSGGDIGAKNGTLTIMVGGDRQKFDEILPYLQPLGKTIRHCGPVGSGQSVKLCNQSLVALHMVALCEAIQLAETQGIDPRLMIDICQTGAAASWALSNLGPKIIAEDYSPGFMVKHLLKDLRLIQASSQSLNLPGVNLAQKLFQDTRTLENALEQGTQAMFRLYHENAIKKDPH